MNNEKSPFTYAVDPSVQNEQSVPLNNETATITERDGIVQAVPVANSDSVQCNICNKYFSSNSLRRKHEKEEHPWNLECKVCSLYFQTQANLEFHMRTHEKKQDRINMMQEHFDVVLSNGQKIQYQCLTCSKTLKSKHHLKAHIKMHENFEETLCPICPMHFRSKISLGNHLSYVHRKEYPMNQPTTSKDKIENFGDLHDNEVHFRVRCGYHCAIMNNEKSPFTYAVDPSVQNEQSVPLNNETATITERDGIVQAVPVANSDSVQCNICNKYFSSNSLRRKHEKEEHPWNLECKVCSLYFQTQANLEFHMRTHEKKQDRINMMQEHFDVVLSNGQKIQYQCLTCSKTLKSKHHLKAHIKMHENFEETLCPICPMHFRSKISLGNHLSYVHRKEYPMNQPTTSKDKIENFGDLHDNEVHFVRCREVTKIPTPN
ncbi:Zinc finger protein 26 [Trichinella spiralis]|uniref:Zinc finger protein 26 n=1 Tax=Trichinella spiralis TaxID=6334 RepID=A0A0V1BAI3_TRISP|nr:Zinc finger protein 26 [Trichinella spiralis]